MQESGTLENAIRELFKAEDLSGVNQYDAGEKHGFQDAKKFLRIKSLPPILQININRFGIGSNGEYKKINSMCEFQETLDFDRLLESTESFMLSQRSSQKSSVRKSSKSSQHFSNNFYRLHAILVHHGSINSGHYYCFIKSKDTGSPEGQWYKFNDMTVTKVPAQTAISTGKGGYNSHFEFGKIETIKCKKAAGDMTFGAGSKQIKALLSKLTDEIDFKDENTEEEDVWEVADL